MHRMRWALLQEVKRELDADLVKIYGPSFLATPWQLLSLPYYIFAAVAFEKKQEEFLKKNKMTFKVNDMLQRCGKVFKNFIETGAGEIVMLTMKEKAGLEMRCAIYDPKSGKYLTTPLLLAENHIISGADSLIREIAQ
jgi:hypothetical protein